MKVLLTGANGFLGYYLTRQLLARNYDVVATGRGELREPVDNTNAFDYAQMDFTDPWQVHDVFEKFRPGVVIHAGAMSKPDDCERNQALAYQTNTESTVHLLLNAAELKAKFIFVSTDFVFDGQGGMYNEDDKPCPVNYYGRTKLEAEEAVKEYDGDWAIVRTVFVYGKNYSGVPKFLDIISSKLRKGEEYSVPCDQQRTPTYVEDLAAAIVAIIEKKCTGVFHISGAELLSPFEFALKISANLGADPSLIKPVTAGTFKEPARRPLKTGFDISKARSILSFVPTSIDDGLAKSL